MYFFLQTDKTKEASIPELPEGNILIETVLEADVDKVYEMIYETDSFFDTLAVKNYDEVENFSMSAWQGNLLRGSDNCSGLARSVMQVHQKALDNRFATTFPYFNPKA